jgi:hypothetical protein
MEKIPEIDGVAFVLSWKFPNPGGPVASLMIGNGTPITQPARLLRLARETVALLEFQLGMLRNSMDEMESVFESLAKDIRDKLPPKEQPPVSNPG